MDLNVVALLRCPDCRSDRMIVADRFRCLQFNGSDVVRLWEGTLGCAACGARFGVDHGVATLLKGVHAAPGTDRPQAADVERRDMPPRDERLKEVAEMVRPRCSDDAAADFDYRVFHAEDRQKHVQAIEGLVHEPVRAILDIGGGQGGLLTSFGARYRPSLPIMMDLDPLWVRVASTRNPDVTVIRADATNLPFRDATIDLVVTTSTLEHVAGWRAMLSELARVAAQAYVSYGYNKFFPYEKGHIDAPFVTFLPKPLGQYIAYWWLKAIGKPRPRESIKRQLDETFFLSRNDAASVLRRSGMSTRSVFRGFLHASVRADYHYFGGGLKRFLARHDGLLEAIAWFFDTTRSEPIVYLFASHAG
jgi:hypothetical protein